MLAANDAYLVFEVKALADHDLIDPSAARGVE
jgi:hypothetical protein